MKKDDCYVIFIEIKYCPKLYSDESIGGVFDVNFVEQYEKPKGCRIRCRDLKDFENRLKIDFNIIPADIMYLDAKLHSIPKKEVMKMFDNIKSIGDKMHMLVGSCAIDDDYQEGV